MKMKFTSPQSPDRFTQNGSMFSPRQNPAAPATTFNVTKRKTNYDSTSARFQQWNITIVTLDNTFDAGSTTFKGNWATFLTHYTQAIICGCIFTPMDPKKLYRTVTINRSFLGLPPTSLPPPVIPWERKLIANVDKFPGSGSVPNSILINSSVSTADCYVIFGLGGGLNTTPIFLDHTQYPVEVPVTNPVAAAIWAIPNSFGLQYCTFLSNAVPSDSSDCSLTGP